LKRSLESLLEKVDRFAADHGPLRPTALEQKAFSSQEPADRSTSVYVHFHMDVPLERLFKDAESAFPDFDTRRIQGR
jgi:hypothetical protein